MSFGKPETDEITEEEELSPGMAQIVGKLEKQEKKYVIASSRPIRINY